MNILGIGPDKSQSRYFTGRLTEPEDETERGQGLATPPGGVARGTRATTWCVRPVAPLRLVFWLRESFGKISTLAFVRSNSENIHFLACLEPKTEENRQLALWHLVNRLVPENV